MNNFTFKSTSTSELITYEDIFLSYASLAWDASYYEFITYAYIFNFGSFIVLPYWSFTFKSSNLLKLSILNDSILLIFGY